MTLDSGCIANETMQATSNLTLGLNNPDSATTIIAFTFWSTNSSHIESWSTTPNGKNLLNYSAPYSKGGANSVNAGAVNSYVFYPFTVGNSETILASQSYEYVITFGNGQQISGTTIVQ